MSYSHLAPEASQTQAFQASWLGMAEIIHRDVLNTGTSLDHKTLQDILDDGLGQPWSWREGYDTAEIAARLFLRQWLKPMTQSAAPAQLTTMLERLQRLLPTQRFRSEEQNQLQQFSTPIALAYLASQAAQIKSGMTILEPSAGTGALAIFAEQAGATLQLNEISEHRHELLSALFPDALVTQHHVGYIHAKMQHAAPVDAVLMNPPFSADPNKPLSRSSDETVKHFQSAFYRLRDGGRAVIITGDNMTASRLVENLPVAAPRFSVNISGSVFARQGTGVDIGLHIIDKHPDDGGRKQFETDQMTDLAEIIIAEISKLSTALPSPLSINTTDLFNAPKNDAARDAIAPLEYHPNPVPVSSSAGTGVPDTGVHDTRVQDTGVFQAWKPGAMHIPKAHPHPTPLAEAVAMASIRPNTPSYQPLLPTKLIDDGVLSDAQLETIIHAGEAHSVILPQHFEFDDNFGHEVMFKCEDDAGFQLRQGFFIGDGTGAGKGRQVAGIILDNRNQGRRKSLWVSKSDKLVEDAKRDWLSVGGDASEIIPLSKYKQGEVIKHPEGILFTTYATLRSGARNGNPSRLDQIINWLGDDFDGCMIFDESHAMGNAAGGERSLKGTKSPSKQGIAGLALQNRLPVARVCYVSATGAASVNALAYATRLGLWSQPSIPFEDRLQFVTAMTEGGVAAAEIVARDLKALGLYIARNLSYDGIEVDVLDTPLNETQRKVYDQWAEAFLIIHNNLEAALQSTGIVDSTGATRNKNAKGAVRSAFESTKQRFFNHLLTSMKCPILFDCIDADLEAGHAAVLQIVSTGEAAMERCLDRVHPSEWNDLQVDITPKDTVLDYLMKAFPTQMHVEYQDEDGNIRSTVMNDDDGNIVHDPVALAARDELIEKLVTLPPMPTALDQLIWRYGKDAVAEVTGRSRRVVQHEDGRMMVERRSNTSGLTEAQVFMNDEKQILIFSEAGGTGRSYHADATVKNQRRRIHYLLEPGWRADNAIQGLGRSNRTGQISQPVLRPISTDVKGEKRFIATIARRLDTLGAITRGQRDTASQGMFKEEDNLESPYARAALIHFYKDLYANRIDGITLGDFEAMTGLTTVYEGQLRDDLPPMHTFLNRLLALPIATQNGIFAEIEMRMVSRIEIAKQNGTYELGVETIRADHIKVKSVEDMPCETKLQLHTIETQHRIVPTSFARLTEMAVSDPAALWCQNSQSEKFALVTATAGLMLEDGIFTPRVLLTRPDRQERIDKTQFDNSSWKPVDQALFKQGWQDEISQLPEFKASTFTMVTGTLLPVWNKLPRDMPKVRRLTTDDGDVLLGRLLTNDQVNNFRAEFGLEFLQPTPEYLWRDLNEGHDISPMLASKLFLWVRQSYGKKEVLVGGHTGAKKDWLKQQGCIVDIKDYQSRFIVPDIACLTRLLEACPVTGYR